MLAQDCAMPEGKLENRRFARVRPAGLVAKTGKLFLDSKSPAIECQVVDLSSGGASLWLSKPVQMPRNFQFIHGGVKKSCYLVWQKNLRVGIGF
jgi:hypothetical protein